MPWSLKIKINRFIRKINNLKSEAKWVEPSIDTLKKIQRLFNGAIVTNLSCLEKNQEKKGVKERNPDS